MATPTWDQLIRPVLELGAKQPFTRNQARDYILKVVPMTKDEAEGRLQSGALRIGNRTGWAMSHLTKAKLIEKVAKATYETTDAGKKFLKEHEGQEISYHDLKKVDGFLEAWKSASEANKGKVKPDGGSSVGTTDLTPEDLIDQAVEEVEGGLRAELLDQLATVDPFRFEQVVIDLLFAMGYGGSREEAAKVTKKSGDEGIDGIINEDRLGLDVIYVQAKRWKSTVGRPDVQGFVGALAGKQAQKGVFITTSNFTADAIQFARGLSQKVILIDGIRLADLMIEHDIGVSTTRTIALKRIDTDYFEEN
jgi:restriction system protein